MIICINGKFVHEKEAKISVFDHGLLYGDGIFDTIAAVNNKIFWLEEHIARLVDGCKKIDLRIPWSKKELIKLTEATWRKNNKKNARIRIMITRGENGITIYDSKKCKPNLIIFSVDLKFYSKKYYKNGMKLITTETMRILPQSKNLSFLPSVLGCLQAKKLGYDDALFVENDLVKEGTTFNIFLIKGNKIKTPNKNILKGVTAEKVIEMTKNLGFSIKEEDMKLTKLQSADEVFITGTTKKIVPVIQINKTKINNGKVGEVTKKLMNKFSEIYF